MVRCVHENPAWVGRAFPVHPNFELSKEQAPVTWVALLGWGCQGSAAVAWNRRGLVVVEPHYRPFSLPLAWPWLLLLPLIIAEECGPGLLVTFWKLFTAVRKEFLVFSSCLKSYTGHSSSWTENELECPRRLRMAAVLGLFYIVRWTCYILRSQRTFLILSSLILLIEKVFFSF